MIDFLSLAQGGAHGLLFGILAVSGTGKFVGCRVGSRIMCMKSGLDFGLALAASLLFWPGVVYLAAVLAIGIASYGWLGEIVRKSKVCNCFGVLTATLEPWRNHARAGMIVSGAILLATGLMTDGGSGRNAVTILVGAALGLAVVLMIASHAFAQGALSKKPVRTVTSSAAPSTQPVPLTPLTFLGTHADGKTTVLGDLIQPGKPLALLLSSRDCDQCKTIKAELEPILAKFPFPIHAIVENAASLQDLDVQALFDPEGRFRRSLAIIGVPTMVVVDPETMRVAQPVSGGTEAIRRDIIRLLLNASQPNPGASAPIVTPDK